MYVCVCVCLDIYRLIIWGISSQVAKIFFAETSFVCYIYKILGLAHY